MLKELLTKLEIENETIDKIMKGMKENKIYLSKEENIDERYSKLKGQKEDLEEQLKTANNTLKTLEKSNKDNETLQQTIKDHEETIKQLKLDSEAKIRNLTLDNAIEKALTSAKAKHSDLLASKFDRDKLTIGEDGKVSGLDDQIKGLKESYKDLFEEKITGKEPNNTGTSVQQEDAVAKNFLAYF